MSHLKDFTEMDLRRIIAKADQIIYSQFSLSEEVESAKVDKEVVEKEPRRRIAYQITGVRRFKETLANPLWVSE